MASTLTNIAEHDEMPKFAAAHPGLHSIAEVQFIVACQEGSNRSARISSFSLCSEYIDRCMLADIFVAICRICFRFRVGEGGRAKGKKL